MKMLHTRELVRPLHSPVKIEWGKSFTEYSHHGALTMITTDGRSNLKGIGSNKADYYDENVEDYDTPPFTQRKCVCHVVHSDDDDSLAGRTVTGTW